MFSNLCFCLTYIFNFICNLRSEQTFSHCAVETHSLTHSSPEQVHQIADLEDWPAECG